jgi:hypothetical protein
VEELSGRVSSWSYIFIGKSVKAGSCSLES